MSRVINRWRYFFIHQDPEQEAWLEEQSRQGLHLIRPGVFRFAFAEGQPREDTYRLDFQTLKGAARDEYLGLFRDAGWEFLGQVANRYYFRAGPGALGPEIFSDVESRKERIRRQMRIGGVITALLAMQASLGIVRLIERFAGRTPGASMGASVLTVVLAGTFACLGLWGLWQMEQAYRRQR